jgi:hypothetical protein
MSVRRCGLACALSIRYSVTLLMPVRSVTSSRVSSHGWTLVQAAAGFNACAAELGTDPDGLASLAANQAA